MASKLPKGWRNEDGRLRADYRFRDFREAMGFLIQVAFAAETMQHHPDFTVHWNEVHFEVWSHDAGKVTGRDRKLVAEIAKIHAAM